MQLHLTSEGSTLCVVLDGRLDLAGVHAVGDQFAFRVGAHDGPVLVDCAALTFVASLGMGTFVQAAKALRRKGHSITLRNLRPEIDEVLRTAGLHNIMTIESDSEDRAPRG